MRAKTSFSCQACGHQSPRWLGRCPDCSGWNTMKEERQAPTGKGRPAAMKTAQAKATPIADIEVVGEDRRLTHIGEFDRVLGGGVIPGSVILIGGDPGIGKTTLLLQALPRLSSKEEPVLYVSGEESPRQIKMRGQRLGIEHPNLLILAETSLEQILKAAQEIQPAAMVVDSIQTVYTEQITSAPGSISQVQEVAGQLMWYAKRSSVPVFIIGHVTKDGAIAGPRLLEHIVDTVLYFEGDKGHSFRILRAVKNRFGSTNEIGVFEMKDSGLEEVSNPSELFLGGTVPAHDGIGGGVESRRIAADSGRITSLGVFHELCDAETHGEWRGAESSLAVARGHGEAAGYAFVRTRRLRERRRRDAYRRAGHRFGHCGGGHIEFARSAD